MPYRYLSVILIVLFLTSTIIPSHAGLVDDWLDQHITADNGYFEGQKRGYYTFGSFSGRLSTGTINPISIAPPRISAGCGGIDAFLGSMSFSNFEYLVSKLQSIMQNAPVIAFEMALGVLSEQMKNTLNQVEEFLNSLNNIQINECQASKALVATFADSARGTAGAGEKSAEFLVKSGLQDFWTSATDIIKTSGGDSGLITDGGGTPIEAKRIEGCPADLMDVFGSGGSLLDNIATKINIDSQYIELIRGLAGDVLINISNGVVQGIEMPSCKNNNQFVLDDFLNGTVEKQNSAWQCSAITDVNADIEQYVSNQMLAIMSNMINGGTLTGAQEDFINALPIPLYPVLKSSIGTGQENVILALMSNVAARAYVFMMLSDAYKMFHDVLDEGYRIITAVQGAAAGQESYTCDVSKFENVDKSLLKMKTTAYTLTSAVREAYSSSAAEVNSILELITRMQYVKDQVHYLVSTRYGQQVANRSMGGVSPSGSN